MKFEETEEHRHQSVLLPVLCPPSPRCCCASSPAGDTGTETGGGAASSQLVLNFYLSVFSKDLLFACGTSLALVLINELNDNEVNELSPTRVIFTLPASLCPQQPLCSACVSQSFFGDRRCVCVCVCVCVLMLVHVCVWTEAEQRTEKRCVTLNDTILNQCVPINILISLCKHNKSTPASAISERYLICGYRPETVNKANIGQYRLIRFHQHPIKRRRTDLSAFLWLCCLQNLRL